MRKVILGKSMADESRYILAKKIAHGGMAEIYLGKHVGDEGFQRLCAIKRILPHYAQDQEFIQMFRDEAHICKRLQHANIVRVEGFEEVEGSFAIIMEFVDGADLRTLLHAVEQSSKKETAAPATPGRGSFNLAETDPKDKEKDKDKDPAKRRRKPFAIPHACYIIAEAARGLHYAHTKVDEITQQALGIVHRDISPQNILVSYEGEVKITDFGIADAENKLTETRPGIVKGKYSYMSPEQIAGKNVDARTDVFALAIVLWEMLAMRRLFQGENEVDTIQRVKNCRIDVELRQENPDVDEELDEILRKALAKDLRKRFKSAADLEKELRRYMSRRYPDFTPEDLGGFVRKHLGTRRAETAAEIKRTLTETNQRPSSARRALSSNTSDARPALVGRTNSLEIAIDEQKKGPTISVANPIARNTSTNQSWHPQASKSVRSSTKRPPMTRGPVGFHSGGSPLRRGNNGAKLVMLMLAAACCLAIGIFAHNMSGKNAPSQLILRTLPARVKVTVDDKVINRGRYVRASSKSPLRLSLPPGEHTLIIQRPGYTTSRWTFNIDEGETITKDDIVLKERSPRAEVRITAKPLDRTMHLDINEGYVVATLSPTKYNRIAPDLFANKPYTMRIKFPDEEPGFTCLFTPNSTNPRQPNVVTIDRRTKKCTMTGS